MTFTVGDKGSTRGRPDGSEIWAFEVVKDSGSGAKPLLVILSKDGVEKIQRYPYQGFGSSNDYNLDAGWGNSDDLIKDIPVPVVNVWYLLTDDGIDTSRFATAEDAVAHFKIGTNLASLLNFKRFNNNSVNIEAIPLTIQPEAQVEEPKETEPTPLVEKKLTREDVAARFITTLTKCYGTIRVNNSKDLDESASLMNSVGPLHLDSLDQVEILMMMEEEFNIEITDDEAERVRVVGDAIDLIWSKVNKS